MSSQSVASIAATSAFVLLVTAAAPAPARADTVAYADVIYASFERTYVNAGVLDGVRVGDVLPVERGGVEVGRLEIMTVGDHTASGRFRTQGTPKTGDRIVFSRPLPRAAAKVSSPQGSSAVDETELAALWTASNRNAPPALVRYDSVDEGIAVPSITGHAETDYHLSTYFGQSSLLRNEQHVSFWTRGENLGYEGLDVRIRGQIFARYDSNADHYMDGRHAVPLFREVAISYRPEDRPFFGAAGRFSPRMPQSSIVDGVEAGADLRSFSISAFGGLKPDNQDLVPTIHRQTFGALVSFRPDFGKTHFQTDEGVMAEVENGRFSRTAVSIDNRFSAGAKVFASQIATFEFLGTDGQGRPVSDFAVSMLGLDIGYRMNEKSTVDFRGRYDEQTVFVEDAKTLSEQWLAALRGRRHGRAEVGLSTHSKKGNRWRPFVFGLGDFHDGIETAYTGAGFQLEDPSFLSTHTRMFTAVDVGFGTGQLANINISFDTPILEERLSLRSGLYNTYQRNRDTSVNTLRHLLFLVLNGHIVGGLDLFADFSATYDHALVRLTYPFGGQMQLELGATYSW